MTLLDILAEDLNRICRESMHCIGCPIKHWCDACDRVRGGVATNKEGIRLALTDDTEVDA